MELERHRAQELVRPWRASSWWWGAAWSVVVVVEDDVKVLATVSCGWGWEGGEGGEGMGRKEHQNTWRVRVCVVASSGSAAQGILWIGTRADKCKGHEYTGEPDRQEGLPPWGVGRRVGPGCLVAVCGCSPASDNSAPPQATGHCGQHAQVCHQWSVTSA